MSKLIWENRAPNKGDAVMLKTEQNKVVGIYDGYDKEKDEYILKAAAKATTKYGVYKPHVISGRILN